MAAHKAELHPDEKITMEKWAGSIFKIALVVGVIGLAATVLLGFREGARVEHHGHAVPRFYFSYLAAIAYFLTIAVGALFFVILQHLVRSKWSVVVRRIPEVLTSTFPVLLVLTLGGVLLPVALGYEGAYGHWANKYIRETDHVIHSKAGWLDPTFFTVRVILYFVIWTLLGRYFFGKSLEQDESGDPKISDRLRVASAPSMFAFAFATTFGAFDLLMSLNPHWFSTIFGVYFFGGCSVAIYASMALIAMAIQKRGILTHSITVEHYHDIGKLLFAFVFFWSYSAFSQFMLIWYANLPEETIWYQPRMFTSWKYLSYALLFGHCIFPFLCLLSRWTKRVLKLLAFFAVWMLVMHYLDIFYIVMPQFTVDRFSFDIADITALLGVGGFFVAAAARTAGRVKLIPVRDPSLGDSLRFENY